MEINQLMELANSVPCARGVDFIYLVTAWSAPVREYRWVRNRNRHVLCSFSGGL